MDENANRGSAPEVELKQRRGVRTIEVDDELMQDIADLVRSDARTVLLNILADLHPADIADIVEHLESDDQSRVFDVLDAVMAGEVLLELDPGVRESLTERLSTQRLSSIVSQLDSDDATDLVAELPEEVAQKVLAAIPKEESAEVKELLQFPEDTAGGIMAREFIAVNRAATIKKALQAVRRMAKEGGNVLNVYVVDDEGRLCGYVPLQNLVIHSPNRKVYKVMSPDVISVRADLDQEAVAEIFKKYDILSLPVVDGDNRVIGRITVDDVVDVIHEEHAEDVARIIGSDAAELERRSPAQIAALRLPWVLATLAIEFAAGVVIHFFDQTLSKIILLASFLPIISAISGNTGLQSAAIVVRAMATGYVDLGRWWVPIWRQLQTTLILGGVCGVIIGFIGGLWYGRWEFGFVVGVSMFISINFSGFVGTSVPMLSKSLGFDPALTAGPFETAFQDVVGITIFLGLATLMVHWLQ